jgi:hypothetical protein
MPRKKRIPVYPVLEVEDDFAGQQLASAPSKVWFLFLQKIP